MTDTEGRPILRSIDGSYVYPDGAPVPFERLPAEAARQPRRAAIDYHDQLVEVLVPLDGLLYAPLWSTSAIARLLQGTGKPIREVSVGELLDTVEAVRRQRDPQAAIAEGPW